jgi:hypothetical protein
MKVKQFPLQTILRRSNFDLRGGILDLKTLNMTLHVTVAVQ